MENWGLGALYLLLNAISMFAKDKRLQNQLIIGAAIVGCAELVRSLIAGQFNGTWLICMLLLSSRIGGISLIYSKSGETKNQKKRG